MTDALPALVADDALVGILAFQVVVLLIVLSNAVLLVRPGRARAGAATPLVSLLVPARNEAANIEACVRSLLAQTYPRLEVVVLDDRSEDATRAILERERAAATAAGDGRLVVLAGEEPPAGWTGKNWACHQLALAAQGEVLLFADADTVFVDPDAVTGLVRALEASRADLLSGLPRQVLGDARRGAAGAAVLLGAPLVHAARVGARVAPGAGRPRGRPADGVPPRRLRRASAGTRPCAAASSTTSPSRAGSPPPGWPGASRTRRTW